MQRLIQMQWLIQMQSLNPSLQILPPSRQQLAAEALFFSCQLLHLLWVVCGGGRTDTPKLHFLE